MSWLQQPPAPPAIERETGAMGTRLWLSVAAPERARALTASEAALRAIEDCEARLSTWRSTSELARLNDAPAGTWVALAPASELELRLARGLAHATDGSFDPGCGRLLASYELRGAGRWPSPAELAQARAPGALVELECAAGRARLLSKATRIEEGSFGKGAGLDRAREALIASGASSARIDLGGQLLAFGQPWRVEIADPDQRERAVLALWLEDASLASSGNAEQRRLVDGRALGHLFDARSGQPAADFGSVSVLAPSALAADALSTALFVAGPEHMDVCARRFPSCEYVALVRRGAELELRCSTGLLGRLERLDARVRPAAAEADAEGVR